MTTVTIVPDPSAATYRASAGSLQSTGRTLGEALDALSAQMAADPGPRLVRNFEPDDLFTAEQCRRLGELMTHWRAACDGGVAMPADERAELDALIEMELEAATLRAATRGPKP